MSSRKSSRLDDRLRCCLCLVRVRVRWFDYNPQSKKKQSEITVITEVESFHRLWILLTHIGKLNFSPFFPLLYALVSLSCFFSLNFLFFFSLFHLFFSTSSIIPLFSVVMPLSSPVTREFNCEPFSANSPSKIFPFLLASPTRELSVLSLYTNVHAGKTIN